MLAQGAWKIRQGVDDVDVIAGAFDTRAQPIDPYPSQASMCTRVGIGQVLIADIRARLCGTPNATTGFTEDGRVGLDHADLPRYGYRSEAVEQARSLQLLALLHGVAVADDAERPSRASRQGNTSGNTVQFLS